MTKEICLVEVRIWFVKKGETYWADGLGQFLWETELKTAPIRLSNKQSAFWEIQTPHDIYFEADNCSFSFRTFGQGIFDEHTNALDWIIDEIGIDEVFESWLPNIQKLALSISGEENKKRAALFEPRLPGSHVNIVTAWQYEPFYGEDGEVEAELEIPSGNEHG